MTAFQYIINDAKTVLMKLPSIPCLNEYPSDIRYILKKIIKGPGHFFANGKKLNRLEWKALAQISVL
jgi:hypothetical protein